MAFLSLYRKYRPNSFSDLVGQKHVIRTLKNALEHNRIAHAYLFAGPRGTGKTSTAKIFAQSLNCVEGPTAEPCGECEVCQRIQTGQSIDVIEIDAASNRGIDEIRDLREKVKFYPSEGKYKVYIIDEVHMLTKGAFNALLKTLEEPPENVVFILATTEPHKVIDTIHSRCQRFDFSLLSSTDIIERLEYICNNENVKYDRESLGIIAAASNGGLRDAISLLDQAISYTNSDLNFSAIQDMLGKVDMSFLQGFIFEILKNNSSQVLDMINEVIDSGKGISIFVSDLTEFIRQIMLYKECGPGSRVINFNEEVMQRIDNLAGEVTVNRLVRFLDILSSMERELNYADQPRIVLELGIIKMMSSEADSSLEGLRARIAELEYQVKELQAGNSINISSNDSTSLKLDSKMASAEKDTTNKNEEANDKADFNNKDYSDESKNLDYDRENSKENDIDNDVDNDKENEKESDIKIDIDNKKDYDKGNDEIDNEDIARKNVEDNSNIQDVENAWSVVLDKVKDENISIQAMLKEGRPSKVDNGVLYIQFPDDKGFHKKGAERQAALIQKIVNKVLTDNYELAFISESDGTSKKKIVHNNPGRKENELDKSNDLVDRVVKAFNGKIIKVNHQILEENN